MIRPTARPAPVQDPAVAARRCLAPVVRQRMADLETPISLFRKLRPLGARYLLESAEQGERMGRYSFIGVGTVLRLVARAGGPNEVLCAGGVRVLPGSPLSALRQVMAEFAPAPSPSAAEAGGVRLPGGQPDLPPFYGGAVGFLGYDLVHHLEPRVPAFAADDLGWPDAAFVVAEDVVAIDHLTHRLLLIDGASDGREAAEARLDAIEAALGRPAPPAPPSPPGGRPGPGGGAAPTCNVTPERYREMVGRAKEYIAAGDAFQVVPSQRLCRPLSAQPLDVYRALRSLNPSPYMFYLDFPELDLRFAGASPEMLVRVQGEQVESRATIAGTRPRGRDAGEDEALAADLLADPKERAEHVMLVDLARNDVGRIAEPGSVEVTELMGVERYAAVMHMVSAVRGRLRPGLDAFDVVAAAFPAGTVTGAPKVRAMEIIAELERTRRGPYAGAVGYFGWNGNMDTCIAIRTIAMTGGNAYVQAGAGVVADSDPQREHEECRHKARALLRALDLAEEGLPG